MRIYAQMPRWYTRWLNAWVIGNNPIGALAEWLLPFIEDDAREHIGQGIVVTRDVYQSRETHVTRMPCE